MNLEIEQLRKEVCRLENLLENAKSMLTYRLQKCHHRWGDTVYDPIIIPGGFDPGDPPGTMGIDRRLPFSWPGGRTPRWKRTCMECGLVEFTTETAKTFIQTPKF